MGLDSLDDIEVGEGGGEKAQETAKEAQEKKEKASKAMAGIQRTRKDEKKAHKDNDFLYEIIVEIIKDKNYDNIIPLMIELLRIGAPSNIVIGVISLIFDKAVYIIRNCYNKNISLAVIDHEKADKYMCILNYKKTDEIINFNDDNIDIFLKDRINEWIEDIISIISYDPSTIITNKYFALIKEKNNKDMIINFIAGVFTFFLYGLNILVSKEKAFVYSEFILEEITKKLKNINLEEI